MRIILADHHPQALWALKTMIMERSAFVFLGEAVDAEALLALAASCSPDIALIDWELPGRSIKSLIAALHRGKPKPVVVVMAANPNLGGCCSKPARMPLSAKRTSPIG